MNLAVVVLAAGEGTRMKSAHPKVLHQICGQPLLKYVINEAKELRPARIVAVIGHQAEKVTALLGSEIHLVIQDEQRGTAHAVSVSESKLIDFDGTVMVACGDTPLITHDTLRKLFEMHKNTQASATLLSAKLPNPVGYGRIVRRSDGTVERIVEEKDATEDEKKILEINSGFYCFEKDDLFEAIKEIGCQNAQKEFYLTDIVGILKRAGKKIAVCVAEDSSEIAGVNSRRELAQAQETMQGRINDKLMESGVTLVAPHLTFVGPEVEIGKDTIIHPLCFLEGNTKIGEECHLGPSVHLVDMTVGKQVKMENVVAEDCIVEDAASLGPFCRLRPGTVIKKGARVGSYVEIKKSEVGEGSKIPHLSYIGDAQIGKGVNVGAGTITCNYDGVEKHQTVIEDGAFIGSDTMLVAPVKVGKGATTGAGSTINKDVPEDSLALERSEQKIVKGWSRKKGSKNANKG